MVTRVERGKIGRELWNAYVDASPACWWWHRWEWADYLLAHTVGNHDHSFALMAEHRVFGVCVLVVDAKGRAAQGSPLPLPVADDACVDAMRRALEAQPVRPDFMTSALVTVNPAPLTAILPATYASRIIRSQVLDLTRPLEALRDGIRDSYRALIHKALMLYEMDTDASPREYQAVHRKVAGRTREERTWEMMREWWNLSVLNNGVAEIGVMVAARQAYQIKNVESMLGGAYFLAYKCRAYYASAAYLPDTDCAAAVIWTAIKYLKAVGVERLELGWAEEPDLTFFKRGFGGVAVPCMIYREERT